MVAQRPGVLSGFAQRGVTVIGITVLVLASACGGSGDDDASSATTVASITVPTTAAAAATTTTTVVATTTTTLDPPQALSNVIAALLGCDDVSEGPQEAGASAVVQCDSQFAPETVVAVFDDEDQLGSWLALNTPSQLVLGDRWVVAAATEFSDVDQVALAVDGIVLHRAHPLADDVSDQSPPSSSEGLLQSMSQAWDSLEAAIAEAGRGELMAAIVSFNRLVADVPTDTSGEAAALRSAALLNRGLAYENLQSDPPAPEGAAPSAGTRIGLDRERELSFQWLVEAYGESEQEDVRFAVTVGLFEHGFFNMQAGELERAVELFDEAIDLGINSDGAMQAVHIADSMFFRALSLADLGNLEAGQDGLDNLIDLFRESRDSTIEQIVAEAMFQRGFMLGTLGRFNESIEAFDDVVSTFGANTAPDIATQVAFAIYNKGVTLLELGETLDAIDAFDDLITRFGDTDDPDIALEVARGMFNKALAYYNALAVGRADLAADELITKFSNATDPAILEVVELAIQLRDEIGLP